MILYLLICEVLALNFSPNRGPEDGETKVLLTGELFIPSSDFACKFGDTLSESVVFKSATQIECTAPAGSGSVVISVSYGATSIDSSDQYAYYAVPAVAIDAPISIAPTSGSSSSFHTITISTGVSDGDSLSCRLRSYKVTGEFIDTQSFSCRIPPLHMLSFLDSNTDPVVAIEISRNNQDFISTFQNFVYLETQSTSFALSPTHGPGTGGTSVTITVNSSFQNPKCMFGDSTVDGTELVANISFLCLSPAISQTDIPIVNLKISTNGIDFIEHGQQFTYDQNTSITSYSPTQGTVSGGTTITVQGSGFVKYSTVSCAIGSQTVSAVVSNEHKLSCVTPSSINAETITIQVTMNGLDYYDVGAFQYRNIEVISSIIPAKGPKSGGTKVEIQVDPFYPEDSFCKLGSSFRTPVIIENSKYYCFMPPQSVLGQDSFDLYISSNNQDFESSTVYTYYSDSTLTSLSPKIISNNSILHAFTIVGSNFLDTASAFVKVSETKMEIPSSSVSTTSIGFDFNPSSLTLGKHRVEVSLNDQNYSPEVLYIEVFKTPSLSSLEPSFGSKSGNTPVMVNGIDFVYTPELKCLFGDTPSPKTRYVSSTQIICFSPSNAVDSTVEVKLKFNADTDIIGSLSYEYINDIESSNFSFNITESYNREQLAMKIDFTSDKPLTKVRFGTYTVTNFAENLSNSIELVVPSYSTATVDIETTMNDIEIFTIGSYTFTGECEAGFYCPSPFDKIQCLPGYFCEDSEQYLSVPCKTGEIASSAESQSCDPCPELQYCPFAAMTQGINCPDGYNCENQTGIPQLSTAQDCPAGEYCKFSDTNCSDGSFCTSTDCEEGVWCGVNSLHGISIPNNFETPQSCKPGYICGIASETQSGSGECPIGSYCVDGLEFDCTTGHYCYRRRLDSPIPCSPGLFNSETGRIIKCTPCSVGTYCSGSGNDQETSCQAGKVCETPGSPNPTSLCPAGTYCLEGRESRSISHSKGPTLCLEATYCLLGVKSSVVVEGDTEYPQTCIEGTYCEEGTDSPAAEKCPAGSYCPSGVSEPTPARQGRYSEGIGNAIDVDCQPGTYADVLGKEICDPCTAGYYCPEDGTIVPIICPAGTYRPLDKDIVYCINCPEGTWSDTPGLASVDECKLCDASIVCLQEGMTTLEDAQACPEGYVCTESTTAYSLSNSPCPGGFWCDIETSDPKDYGICQQTYYCPEGTGKTSRTQHTCLQGFYCPPATNATVNSLGEFEYINQADYSIVIDARLAANAECEASEEEEEEEDCEIYDIPVFEMCEEDKLIPPQLLTLYTSLMCPSGTTSSSGSWCVGQCTSIGADEIVEIINPIMNTRRDLQEETSDYHEFTLNPLDVGQLLFDFRQVNPLFLYNEHFRIRVRDSTNATISLPAYFDATNVTHHELINLSIINYSSEPQVMSVGILLHNALFQPMVNELQNTLNLTVYTPDRNILRTDDVFFSIVFENDFTGMSLPYNLIKLTGDGGGERSPLVLGVGSNSEWEGEIYNFAPFDETYWMTYEATAINMPWIPFLMNCETYGDRIYIHRLLEDAARCNLIDESSTIVVDPIPIGGFSPTADQCDLQVQCTYAENVQVQGSDSELWYTVQEDTTLFYLTANPQKLLSIFDVLSGTNYDSVFKSAVQDLTEEIIEVKAIPMVSPGIPRTVELNIEYYQVDTVTKNLVNMEVRLTDYSEDTSNLSYSLKVKYRALGWLDLLNSFKLGIPVFILIFILISAFILGLVLLLYTVHLAFLRGKNPPQLHFKVFFLAASVPAFLGTFYGSFPIFIIIIILNTISQDDPWVKSSADWGNIEEPDANQAILNNRGRLGMSLLFVSIMMLYYGSQLLIPLPDPPEEEEENEDGEGNEEASEHTQISKQLSQTSGKSEDGPGEGEEGNEEENGDLHHDANHYTAMLYKQKFFFIVCIFLGVVTTFKLELSYTEVFINNIFLFFFFFMFIDMILYQLFSRLILHEALLVSPFLASLAINEIIMTLAADTFIGFISCYLFSFMLTIVQRIYINPFIEYFESKIEGFIIYLMERSRFFEKIFKKMIVKNRNMHSDLFSDEEAAEGQRMEALLGTMVEYSAQVQANLMAPFVLTFILFFANATQLTKNYNIKQNDVSYYLLFSCIIIIPQLTIDIFLFHLVEALYSYKLFDYLTYCAYRFKTRKEPWKHSVSQKLDRSILLNWRSIDSMSYSSQYYYSVTIASWGIISLSLSFTIMMRNSFNPFADPMFLQFFAMQIAVQFPFKKALKIMSNLLQIWKPRSHPVFIDDSPPSEEDGVVELIDQYVEENEFNKTLQSGLFRAKFIRKNKRWIVENLDRIVGQDPASSEFVRKVYDEIHKQHKIRLQELKKEQVSDDILTYIRHKQQQITEESCESEREVPSNLPKPSVSTALVASEWLSQAKFALEFKHAVDSKAPRDDCCESCGSEEALQTVHVVPFHNLFELFKVEFAGEVLNVRQWKRFYERNQVFRTLCSDCTEIERLKKLQDENVFEPLVRIAKQEFQLLNYRYQRAIPSPAKKIALMWLLACRSRLLNREAAEAQEFISRDFTQLSSLSRMVSDI